ncbi:PH domain-containing protein [Siminovitchia terrae]|uniref:PH domain-containing protein n=1 Tax=Siminovitchia terrae TaxID=1914933 RepID=UPI0028ACC6FA|nr:PH domain-containing protein [Siminovitchia terrae]
MGKIKIPKKLLKLIEQSKEHLDADEEVLYSVLGVYEAQILGNDSVRNGIFLATNKRLFFYAKKLGGYESESFPYSNISSFEASKGMMGHAISFFASGNKVKMKWIQDGDIDGFINHVRQTMGKKASSKEPVNTGARSVVEELKELASLRDNGILTDEEFQKEKEKILNH